MTPENKNRDFKGRKVYERMVEILLYQGAVEELNAIVHPDFLGYGTAAHEFLPARESLVKMALTQSEQLQSGNIEIRRNLVQERFLADGSTYLIVEEFDLHDQENDHHYKMRVSSVLEKIDESWLVTHVHASTPDSNIADDEALPDDGLRQRNRELELKIKERTRELEIETALERVRSRSMAMQQSDELDDMIATLFSEMIGLDVDVDVPCIITHFENGEMDLFMGGLRGSQISKARLPLTGYSMVEDAYEAWKKDKPDYANQYDRTEKDQFFKKLIENLDVNPNSDSFSESIPDGETWRVSTVNLSNSIFIIQRFRNGSFTDETLEVQRRFAKLFEQTYTRYLDLKKAEEQAREAKIEAALERVRGRSMAMQKSQDLRSVVDTLYGEFHDLNVDFDVVAIQLIPNGTKDLYLWLSTDDGMYDDLIHWPYTDIPIFQEIHNAWEGNQELEHQMDESETTQFFEEYYKLDSAPEERKAATKHVEVIDVIGTYQKHTGVFLMRYSEGSFSHYEKNIVARFSKAVEQTYTRFLDLQKAEKLAFESARQSSLDRIRAEIASMRSADDLQQITPIIWDELKTMGIPFIRCGVFIIDEANGLSHTYLSTAQGEPIAALHLPLQGISLVENLKKSWGNEEIYTVHWDEKDFRDWTQNLIDKGFIDSKKKYEAGSAPITLDLHFLPFKHGMLYIGNTEPLSKESLDLGQSMANAFSVAYGRYEDFVRLDQAKQKIEDAFKELKAAQEQLVQQEKLASLGQLTAGIAHEIKNPLNFVNNFSDVSMELVEEIRVEVKRQREKGKSDTEDSGRDVTGDAFDTEPILDILNDIETNLRTIHKHGTRADSIVKSMLQHSRGGDGKLELTLLSSVIKEYVNLAFHGMRASKGPINVDIELELDESIGEIPLIGDDFSRVILNLCNNAFDAMRDKVKAKSESNEAYDPKLIVRTFRKGNTVIIEVEDNGPGIPDYIKDKILQPFFTTKKGTAGTGLGLSITNDIIKAHGGQLHVQNSPEGGTVFSIVLPA